MRITVVGGGTAGWLTALYIRHARPNDEISLIESPVIGILGAGEGTTPHIINFLDFVQIPTSDIIKNCGATIKSSIKFTGWSGKGSYYHHQFGSYSPTTTKTKESDLNRYIENRIEDYFVYAAVSGTPIKSFVLTDALDGTFKVPFKPKYLDENFNIVNPIQLYEPLTGWALHFDARLLAEFLQKVAVSRGIKHVTGLITDASTDQNGNITKLHLEGFDVETDFVFDCSGFNSFISNKVFKSKRTSHRNQLPADKAQAFFIDSDISKLPAYTESVCMDAGWMWKIPLQHRYGCGYVYSSEFADEERVVKDIKKAYPKALLGKSFSFPSDHLHDIWTKNCLSVGLSTGFIEPLEATSIFHALAILKRFFSEPTNINTQIKANMDRFNSEWRSEIQEIIDFIYLHYVVSGTGSKFWKAFSNITEIPEFVKYIIDVAKYRPPNDTDFNGRRLFECESYTNIMYGQSLITDKTLKDYFPNIVLNRLKSYEKIVHNHSLALKDCVTHQSFLENMIHHQ